VTCTGHTGDDTARAAVDGWGGAVGAVSARIIPRRIPVEALDSVYLEVCLPHLEVCLPNLGALSLFLPEEKIMPTIEAHLRREMHKYAVELRKLAYTLPGGVGEHDLLELSERMNTAADETPKKYLANMSARTSADR
jgi:hypothetical protein